jgi:pyrroloquinoline-quinone synthase
MSEPPFGPEDLRDPPLAGSDFVKFLQEEKARKYPTPPPFYQMLFEGRLNPEQLKLWVKDMYVYWDHGLVYSTGAIFVKTNDEEVRTNILRKMVDIEGKEVVNDLTGWTTPAYEELWLRFGEGLGMARDEITSWKSFTRTHYALSTLCMLSRWWEWSWLDGIASFYAADLHGKECLENAPAALKKFYRVPDGSLEFFSAYLEDIPSHVAWEERALSYWTCTRERQLTAAKAFRKRLDIENQLLVSVHRAATTERLPLQVP